ncbi:calcium:proton antiporter [Sphingobacterium paucimobilis]|uniref:Sodium/calcium exchanger membrane region domain-containing protein n=1 Tax=Sphingobacterium paucimobilis HER1398 TaxID=1346330 RepID=U2H967_9SPHI|nr:hypothetical protein [Sphingobacterium paucimobilis]ERJ58276.1 hypothetical protein M472_05815 [Sphingobacterium paucimobilis HER1398]
MNTILSKKTTIRLAIIWLVVLTFSFLGQQLTQALTPLHGALLFILLLSTIVYASFGVVKEADELAHKLGEPYGTLILTLSIVAIEVILISAVLLGPGESAEIAKDSIFSVMMIIMNLVIGICLLFGGLKYGEQEYNAQGTMTYLSMIIMLSGIALLLPNFIQGAGNGIFSNVQAIGIATLVSIMYACFLAYQMKDYRHLYLQPQRGHMEILYQNRQQNALTSETGAEQAISKKEIVLRSILLIAMILPIVLLSHYMATVVDYGIKTANLPPLLGGILIAVIVFTPESMTAVKAALNNEFQRAINLCHGAFVSTVGLTVPAVLIIGLLTGKTVALGLTATETILFVITLLLSLMTFLGKRTSPILGIMHIILFALFILLVFNP